MNELDKVKTVMLCVLCEAIDCTDHEPEFHYKAYQDQLCLTVHSLLSEASSCCMEMTNKDTLDPSCFAKEKKGVKKEAEVPVASLQGRRDK